MMMMVTSCRRRCYYDHVVVMVVVVAMVQLLEATATVVTATDSAITAAAPAAMATTAAADSNNTSNSTNSTTYNNGTTTTTTTTQLWPEQSSFGVGGYPLATLDFLQLPANKSAYTQSKEKCVYINGRQLCSSVDHCPFSEFYREGDYEKCTDYSWIGQPEETRGEGGWTCSFSPNSCQTSARWADGDCDTLDGDQARPGIAQVGGAICAGQYDHNNNIVIPRLEISAQLTGGWCTNGDFRFCTAGRHTHKITYGGVPAIVGYGQVEYVNHIFKAYLNLDWNCSTDSFAYPNYSQSCGCTAALEYPWPGGLLREDCARCSICEEEGGSSTTGGRFAWECRGYSVDCQNNYTVWNVTVTTSSSVTTRATMAAVLTTALVVYFWTMGTVLI